MKCPNDCSSRGECLTLAEIASKHGQTYGTDPNSASTWDANRITACVCDTYDFSFELGNRGDVSDWIGYDCSLRTCPHGNPPWNRNADHEEQRVTCTHDGTGDSSVNGFTFTFNGVTSTVLATAKASSADSNGDGTSVEEILESMTTIGDVEVSFVNSESSACTISGTVVSIRYITNHGDLDLANVAVADGSSGLTVSIAQETAGTTQSVECSGAGRCNRVTGKCECHDGYMSEGRRGDCSVMKR